jgi:uncharacterized BrkB/YihY/UPF0761 family membrane protein
MKTILTKIALIFSSIVLFVVMISNICMFIVTYKLSSTKSFFGSIEILSDYKVFDRLWIGSYSLFLTIILLAIVFAFVIREFVVRNKK